MYGRMQELRPGLAILHPVNVNVKATEFKLSEPVNATTGPWESETGEIIWDNRDSVNAVYKINSPSAKAAIGYIGGKSIDLGQCYNCHGHNKVQLGNYNSNCSRWQAC